MEQLLLPLDDFAGEHMEWVLCFPARRLAAIERHINEAVSKLNLRYDLLASFLGTPDPQLKLPFEAMYFERTLLYETFVIGEPDGAVATSD